MPGNHLKRNDSVFGEWNPEEIAKALYSHLEINCNLTPSEIRTIGLCLLNQRDRRSSGSVSQTA